MTNATGTLADYVAGLRFESIPPAAILKCKEVILDELGVLLRASQSKGASQLITDFVARFGRRGKCTVIGTRLKLDPINAALANGVLGHDILELDEVHSPSGTHAAAVIVPAALAVAENLNASGKALITAVVAAYDVEGRIGIALPNIKGFHRTSVYGSFGAAVAAAKLLGLSREQILNALGSASSQASGTTAFNDEMTHMNKSLQTGVAARNGVTAALLAQMGYLAPPRVLDGKYNALQVFSEQVEFAELTAELGTRFEVTRTGLKGNSCCRVIHAPLEAFLKILDGHGIDPRAIQQVTVTLGSNLAPIVDGHPLMTHNVQKVLATAAFDRKKVTVMEPYSSDRQEDPEVAALARRVKVAGDAEMQKTSHAAGPAVVEVAMKDGRRFTERVNEARGEPSNPFTTQEIEDKFLSLSAPVVGKDKAKLIAGLTLRLDELDDVEELAGLLRRRRTNRASESRIRNIEVRNEFQ